ncbi:peptidase C65 Otubain-domain-containing protein [Thamnocephalis sphaerospora]|uniref:ubiquitinyl hydrolase 1 n=1 Tax=Thamnocephalis sphaerospora TaxID=78915 RepID=A0A4P9XTP1_9FUNG|nr:peptidase C65 Otubain-domain-containing protein [Thamnocephalis sphaerospora]|eukprot:RKP09545.1 peptidase C65 Otubain-domain-containing protein [Thamnocephalis sphaerospora]
MTSEQQTTPTGKEASVDVSDEQILAFEQEVKDAEARERPLIGELEPLSALYSEYERGSPVFCEKIKALDREYQGFRRCRGDGNCFFRAFAFAWFESALSGDDTTLERIRQRLTATKQQLLDVGFDWVALEDFYDMTVELLEMVARQRGQTLTEAATLSNELRLGFVSEQGVYSNAAVVHLRMVASAYLRAHADDYLPFLELATSMDQYCAQHVEAFGRESEEIHIIALTKALRSIVNVVYLDGSTANDGRVSVHPFDGTENATDATPAITLLYRPGHYDILYNRTAA